MIEVNERRVLLPEDTQFLTAKARAERARELERAREKERAERLAS
jgi:hypothetical protein